VQGVTRSATLGPVGGTTKALSPADVQFIAVHCSATGPDADIGVADIDKWHRMKGWLACGYHFVIRRNGKLEAGRSVAVRGAHVEGHNHHSIGICLAGGTDGTKAAKPQANFTSDQMLTLSQLLVDLQKQFPNAVIQGHRDFPGVAKACPSFNVKHWLETGKVIP
jgi:N-acetylmuramoyl-L-alanine amidase